MQREREITQAVSLCLPDGTLHPDSIGWARKPLITSNVRGRFLRKKKWNYWCIFGPDILFSATISNLDYATVCFVYYLEYATKDFFEKTIIIPFDRKLKMPDEVQASVAVQHKQMHLAFIANEQETLLKISADDFNGKYLAADLTITYPEELESLNVVVPWNQKQFQFTAKHHCLPTEGTVTIGDKTYTFHKDTSYAVLDYGRGIWPRKSTWNWGMASGRQGDDVLGINFGGKWTDNTGSTENAVILNGKIYKISEDVTFVFDAKDYMKEWQIISQSGDVALTFTPFFERIAHSNLWLIESEVHQMVGHYHGQIKLPDGPMIKLENFLGCIEDHFAKW